MHRFHSRSTILRFRLAAWLLFLKLLMPAVVLGVLAFGLYANDSELVVIAIGFGVLTFLVAILQWLLASRSRCPLCLTPVLMNKGCSKHRNARTVLGSHPLRVALAVTLKDSFTCPYCHESSVMEVRHRPGYQDHHQD